MKKVELLSPAGDWERLEMCLAYGADAVYLAGELFGMRSLAGSFPREVLERAVGRCHSQGVAVYVTCNTMPRHQEMAQLPAWLESLEELGVDAVILADLGVLALAKRHCPSIPIHISTQASIVNAQAATQYQDLGASRVILARELSLEEIIQVRNQTDKALELEVFVHGAMCMGYSGRCLLSSYMTGRDANRGACAQPCRYNYALMEERRPGEFFPVYEENGESYIMNSRDLCMIDHIGDLVEAGISSLKIEGRAKSAYYAGVITGAYRQGVDACLRGEALDPVWRDEVEHISHRDYSTGFFFGEPGQFVAHSGYLRDWQIVAVVESCDDQGLAQMSLRNKFATGETLEVVGPNCPPFSFVAGEFQDETGEILLEVRHPQMKFSTKLPQSVPKLSMVRRAVGEEG